MEQICRKEAYEIALQLDGEALTVELTRGMELSNGWYFPWISKSGQTIFGSNGVIIDKESGDPYMLGSAYPPERDMRFYEAGYKHKCYDIEISKVHNKRRTLKFLKELGPTVVEPELAHGVTWRIPRQMSRWELRRKLSKLPCTFEKVGVYFRIEIIEKAKESACCDLTLHPRSDFSED